MAVAELLGISVNAAVMTHKRRTRIKGSKFSNVVRASPIAAERPDFYNVKLIAIFYIELHLGQLDT